MAMSTLRSTRVALDVAIDDLKAAGLPAPLPIRCKLFTLGPSSLRGASAAHDKDR